MTGNPIMFRRLRNSGLAKPSAGGVADIVSHHVAMQAQDYGPAKWAVGQRSTALSDDDLDRAVARGSIVRTHVMRPTWHFVAREDIRWLLALTGPRVIRQMRSRYARLGLDAKVLKRAMKVIAHALDGGVSLTRAELGERLRAARVDDSGQRLPHMLSHAELESLVCSGPRRGKDHTYALMDDRVPAGRPFDRDAAVAELVQRYLSSHGPASVPDMRWWSGLTSADVKAGLESLGDEVRSEESTGVKLWSNDATRVGRPRGARLLHPYDEVIVGYTESRYLGDPRATHAREVYKARSMPGGVVLVDGSIAGYWKRSLARKAVAFEVFVYGKPGAQQLEAIETDARRLGTFLGRDVEVSVGKVRS